MCMESNYVSYIYTAYKLCIVINYYCKMKSLRERRKNVESMYFQEEKCNKLIIAFFGGAIWENI